MPAESPLRAGIGALPAGLELIETFRFEPGAGFVRLDRHLARMAASAAAFGWIFDRDAAEALLAPIGLARKSSPAPIGAARSHKEPPPPLTPPHKGEGKSTATLFGSNLPVNIPGKNIGSSPSPLWGGAGGGGNSEFPSGALRIRLALRLDGTFDLAVHDYLPLAADTVWRLALAETQLNSADPLLAHKTSRRDAYVRARAEFAASEADEVILCNERGELCEGSITSLFVDPGSGPLLTPPLSCGLLNGILRAELIETGAAREQVLSSSDLAAAAQILVGNSLRGLIKTALV